MFSREKLENFEHFFALMASVIKKLYCVEKCVYFCLGWRRVPESRKF